MNLSREEIEGLADYVVQQTGTPSRDRLVAAAIRQLLAECDAAEARCAELCKHAQAFCDSFVDHADRCRVCTTNWQNLRAALGEQQ